MAVRAMKETTVKEVKRVIQRLVELQMKLEHLYRTQQTRSQLQYFTDPGVTASLIEQTIGILRTRIDVAFEVKAEQPHD